MEMNGAECWNIPDQMGAGILSDRHFNSFYIPSYAPRLEHLAPERQKVDLARNPYVSLNGKQHEMFQVQSLYLSNQCTEKHRAGFPSVFLMPLLYFLGNEGPSLAEALYHWRSPLH